MKIIYLKLINSAGIMAGLSKKEIEISFLNNDNKIVMLFGGNGSGKSTVLSSLHPFTGSTNDNRNTFFIEGKSGEKIIHYKDNENVYIIHHYISNKKKTRSYFSKISYDDYLNLIKSGVNQKDIEGEELNENGGVKTFNQLVLDYLGIDEEFFKISRIGSNVTNFIDLSTANRKKYIGLFLPDIEEYLSKYKITNEKFKNLNKKIKYISDEILKIKPRNELLEDKTNTEDIINEIERRIDNIKSTINKNEGKIESIDNDNRYKDDNYKNIYLEEMNKIEKEYLEVKEIFENEDISSIKTELSNKEKELNEVENKSKSLKDKKENLLSQLDEYTTNMKSKKSQLDGLSLDDIDELKNIINENTNLLNDYDSQIKSFNIDNINLDDNTTSIIIKINTIKKFYNSLNIIKTKFSNKHIEFFNQCINDNKSISNIVTDAKEKFENKLNEISIEMSNLDKENNELKPHLNELEILKKRPNECVIDFCPFIKNALQYVDIDKTISKNSNKIKELEIQYNEINESKSNYDELFNLINEIKNTINNSNDKNDIIDSLNSLFINLNISDITVDYLIKIILNNSEWFNKESINNLNNVITYLNIKDEYKNVENIKNNAQMKLEANNKIQSLYNSLNNEYKKLNKDINSISEKILDTDNLYNSLVTYKISIEKDIEKLNDKLDKYENYKNIESNYNDILDKFSKCDSDLNEISLCQTKIFEKKIRLNELNSHLPKYKTTLDTIKIQISRLEEYTKTKEELDEKYEKLSLIKTALDPTKGIPIHFIKNYLNNTTFITNDLLNISQNGKFAIKFNIDEKDFYIQVFKSNGDTLNDITDASQGEMALTSLSLSLALIEQSMNKYNIFLLDELDGALDNNNRKAFIEMVEKQIEKLNSEQVFIISHNNEFESYPVDMILLNDNNININDKEFMNNKNIIFSV